MRTLASWMLCGLVLSFGISAPAVWAEDEDEEESVCAGETVDQLLDKATKLATDKKYDDIAAHCFSAVAVKKMEADKSIGMLKEMVKMPEFAKGLADCKGKSTPAADGKTATCAAGMSFEFVDEEWYLAP